MDRKAAAVGSGVFLVAAPGVVAGLVPWLLTGWRSAHPPLAARVAGWLLLVVGATLLLSCFARFVTEGRGTPAPVAPTSSLVVGGVYRYLRNPMYVSVIGMIVAQALVLGRAPLWWWALVAGTAMVAFVYLYEQPTLHRQFGAGYDAYRAAVPGWWPRLTPWRPPAG